MATRRIPFTAALDGLLALSIGQPDADPLQPSGGDGYGITGRHWPGLQPDELPDALFDDGFERPAGHGAGHRLLRWRHRNRCRLDCVRPGVPARLTMGGARASARGDVRFTVRCGTRSSVSRTARSWWRRRRSQRCSSPRGGALLGLAWLAWLVGLASPFGIAAALFLWPLLFHSDEALGDYGAWVFVFIIAGTGTGAGVAANALAAACPWAWRRLRRPPVEC